MEISTCITSSRLPQLTRVFLNAWQKKRSWHLGLLVCFSLISSIKNVPSSFSNRDKTGNEGNLLVFIKDH